MKIYLIRHGETDWNLQGRFQGREDIALNENGIGQAKRCAAALSKDQFKAVITSPLSRARRTGEIIAEHLGVKQFIVEEGITERDFSKVSGMTPKEREAFYALGEKDDKEPWEKLSERMLDSLKRYAEQFPKDNIIMVSHGASINCVLAILSGGKTGTGKIILKNTCINIIHYEKGRFLLEEYNLIPEEYLALKSDH
jgi:broad specificity phosphatase PhoE